MEFERKKQRQQEQGREGRGPLSSSNRNLLAEHLLVAHVSSQGHLLPMLVLAVNRHVNIRAHIHTLSHMLVRAVACCPCWYLP